MPHRRAPDDPLPAPRSARGGGEAILATDITHVIHSWIEDIAPAHPPGSMDADSDPATRS